jgi:DNA polymerase-3 subunit delta'
MRSTTQPGFQGVGQATARGIARGASRRVRLGRTLLIHGPRAAGAAPFVEDLLALLLCADTDLERRPCNACRGCGDGRARRHPDLVIGSPALWRESRSGGESITAAARRWLMEASGAPIVASQRVILIEGVDAATEQTQNVLLKALEEPNPRQLFVLTAEEPSRVLPTIRSRAQALRLGPVPRDELVAWLVEREHLTDDQARAIARIADGMAGTAIGFARNPQQLEWRRRVQGELLALLPRGRAERIAAGRELVAEAIRLVEVVEADAAPSDEEAVGRAAPATAQQRAGALLVLDAWIALARDLAMVAAGRPGLAPATELLDGAEAVGRAISTREVAQAMRALERIRDGVAVNAAPRLAMSAAMLAWPTVGR